MSSAVAAKLKLDTYTTVARLFPAVLTAMPLFVLWFFVVRDAEWDHLLHFVVGLKFLGSISLSAAFLYFYAHFIREVSKFFERRYFVSRRGFPTTYLMLYSDGTYSRDYKDKFRDRVQRSLKLNLLDPDEERADPAEAQRRLTEAFSHIRLKVGTGKLVFKHNVWYGFMRNLVGGSVFAVLFCIANILLGRFVVGSSQLVLASAILLCVHGAILIFNKPILIHNGEAYGRQLISEFMAGSKG
jgi:hypothetical protein